MEVTCPYYKPLGQVIDLVQLPLTTPPTLARLKTKRKKLGKIGYSCLKFEHI